MIVVDQSPIEENFVQNPYIFYRQILNRGGVCFWKNYDQKAFFDFYTINKIFKDKRFGRELPKGLEQTNKNNLSDFYRIENNSMLELEGKRHSRLRGLVLRAFTTKNIQRISKDIDTLCGNLLDQMNENEIDLIESYAKQVPVITIARLLGIPEEMSDQLLKWSNSMVAVYQADISETTKSIANQSSREFFEYIEKYVAERRYKPANDLITHLINAEQDNEKLNFDELVSTCILLLNAGHEATVHTIGNGINALLSNKIDCHLFEGKDWHNVVEEILRYDPPLHIFTRFAYEDLTIDNIDISHGEKISLVIGASGQDMRRWDNPSAFMPNRRTITNNSFGAGTHFCLGAPLARLEINLALKNLFSKKSRIKTLKKPEYANIYHFHGLKSLNVEMS
ncbi:cytochrome P450 [Paracoccaceae bacterium]|nr:cytochrome P450 [Paracoccaceae bacterium]